MNPPTPLHGLTAATHTPFHPDGSLNLAVVEKQCAHLLSVGVSAAFICGTTGESSSLTLDERLDLAERWLAVAKGSALRVVVHVGSNCIADARVLAAHAEKLGAAAISALAPSYFKPRSLELLISCCAEIASAAPGTPFYYYDIPAMTGVAFSMAEFLASAQESIPTLTGLKFTNPDLMAYLQCLHAGSWDLPWGIDEWLLGALATGARGAVGSSYNFAAPIYHRLMRAFSRGDMTEARHEQYRSTKLISCLATYGYMGAAKATMNLLGIDVGRARLPNGNLSDDQLQALRAELEAFGLFD